MSEKMGTVIFSAVMASVSPTIDGSQIRPDNATEVAPSSSSVSGDATVIAKALAGIQVERNSDLNLPRADLGRTCSENEVFPAISGLFAQQLVLDRSAQEVEALYSEHSELVARSFAEGLSPQEKRRFGLVRWHLHQIQSARQGTQLAKLEQRAQEYSAFASQIAQLKAEFIDKLPKRKHR